MPEEENLVEVYEAITSPPTDPTPSTSDITQGVTHEPFTEQVHEANQTPRGNSPGLVHIVISLVSGNGESTGF